MTEPVDFEKRIAALEQKIQFLEGQGTDAATKRAEALQKELNIVREDLKRFLETKTPARKEEKKESKKLSARERYHERLKERNK